MFKFNKHHHNSYQGAHTPPHHHTYPTSPVSGGSNNSPGVLDNNQLGQLLEVGKLVTTAGPENIWRVYDGWRKTDGKEVSIFVFEKKAAEKLHKPRRKETIAEILRSSVRQLERFRHPMVLQVVYPLEEGPETLAFASEPVYSSLSNLLLTSSSSSSSSNQATPTSLCDGNIGSSEVNAKSPGVDLHPIFLDVELRYGILQIVEALQFLHYSGRIIHRNITPSNILVTKRGTWKLAGLEFIDRANEKDGMEGVSVIAWTSKIPKMAQPDLDYTAPEVQQTSMCSIMSDMFSLGMVVTAIFNNGKPLIQSNHSNSQYLKQIEMLDQSVQDFLPKVPPGLHEALARLLCREPRQRPTSQLVALIKYFADPAVATLQYLDVISMKDPSQKAHFYRHQLRDVLPYIPKQIVFRHVWPTLISEMKTQEVLAAALQPIFSVISESTPEEFQNIILPSFKQVFSSPKTIQASVTLLENLHIILEKNIQPDLLSEEILPMLQNAFESTTIQVQCASLKCASLIADYLDEGFTRKIILPKTKFFYEKYSSDIKVVHNILMCLEKIIPKLERSTIIEDVLPILCENAKSQDPDIIFKVVHIIRLMLSDNKKYGLSVNLMATRVMPSLLPQTVNPRLHLEQFCALLEVLQEMLEHIDRNQRNKLKLDHLAPTHITLGQVQKDYSYSNHKGLRHQRSSDNMSSIGPYSTPPPSMFIPNVHIEAAATLNVGGPSFPCQQRKTSSAEDMMMRKNSAELYGDGTNFLRVQGGQYPVRRLSDNTLIGPKIRLAPSSALSSPGDQSFPVRRHSSIGPERKNSNCSMNLSPPMLTRNIVGGSMPNTTGGGGGGGGGSGGGGMPFSLSGSMTSLKSRRPSMLSTSTTSMHGHGHSSPHHHNQANASGILQQLGSGVVSFANSLVDRNKTS